jgi:hypothetical protein
LNLNLSSFGLSLSHAADATVQEEHDVGNDVEEDHQDEDVPSEGPTHFLLEVKEKLLKDLTVESGLEVGIGGLDLAETVLDLSVDGVEVSSGCLEGSYVGLVVALGRGDSAGKGREGSSVGHERGLQK